MPREVRDREEFLDLSERATECRIVRSEETVKLKLRLPRYLYTYVTDEEEAEDLLNRVDAEKVEF